MWSELQYTEKKTMRVSGKENAVEQRFSPVIDTDCDYLLIGIYKTTS